VPKRRGISEAAKQKYLDTVAAGYSDTKAAQTTGHDRKRFIELKKSDEAFLAAYKEAVEIGTQALEDVATDRGKDGYWEETYGKDGELIRRTKRFDSALLQQQLKRRRPEAYRENYQQKQLPPVIVIQSSFPGVRPQGEIIDVQPIELELPVSSD
jgi:hypothetical protein